MEEYGIFILFGVPMGIAIICLIVAILEKLGIIKFDDGPEPPCDCVGSGGCY